MQKMRGKRFSIFLRILAFVLGSVFILFAILGFFENSGILYIGYFFSTLFLFYAVKGNEGFLNTRWFKNYGEKINKK